MLGAFISHLIAKNVEGVTSQYVAIGDPGTGKSTVVNVAPCLSESQEPGYYVKGANAFFLDQANITLPFGIDDLHVGKSTGKTN